MVLRVILFVTSYLGCMTANVKDKDEWESIRSISRIYWHSHAENDIQSDRKHKNIILTRAGRDRREM